MFSVPETDTIVALALGEDFGVPAERFLPGAPASAEILDRDVTTSSVLDASEHLNGAIVAREDLVLAGLPVAAAVWEALERAADRSGEVEVFPLVAEGARVPAGTPVAEVDGLASVVLGGERAALNFLMVLSGIATQAARWQEAVGSEVTIVDTRKTYPGLRALSKYGVLVGGASNHRFGLWDMALIKDNHLRGQDAASAITAARDSHPELLVEVEADTVAQATEAARAGADIVLLDNMDDAMTGEAVRAVRDIAEASGRTVLTEASGGVTFDRLAALRELGIDRISSSELTLAHPADLALDIAWKA